MIIISRSLHGGGRYRTRLGILISLAIMVIATYPASSQYPLVIGPEYAPDPLLMDLNNPKGSRFEFEMPLQESKFFRGDDAVLDPGQPLHVYRKIYVYIPASYKDGNKAPVLVTLDGPGHFTQVSNALDNLTIPNEQGLKLNPFVLVSVQNGGGNGKGSLRGLEYDTMSDRFALFITEEVLPGVLHNKEIRKKYPNFALSKDPWDRAVMGCSSGGAAAFTMGWFRPDLFRRIISYSGTFVDQQTDGIPEEETYPLGAWEYHSGMKLIENSEKKPLRVFIHVSEYDLRYDAPAHTRHNWVMANERMSEALKSKGYACRYVYSLDSGHCDKQVFQSCLAQALVWIWSDEPSR